MDKTYTNKEGNLILEIRDEPLSAWLTIKKTGKLIDEYAIIALLEEAGIKSGFEEAVEYAQIHSLEKEFDIPFPVAMCKKDENKTILRYKFNPDILTAPDMEISYQTLAKLKVFKAGDTVAEYSHNIFEQKGSIYNIFGELIDASSVDPEQAIALAGENVAYDVQNCTYYLLKDGYPYVDEEGHISLLDSITLKASELPSDTIISCPIDLIIEGDLTYANLHCDANLRIEGEVHSCSIECKKDMLVTGDINASSAKGIIVWGNLECSSIHNSYIVCLNNIHFTNKLENSTVVCDGEIIGAPDRSEICGGLTQAGESITAFQAGSYNNTITEIEIAISPFYRNLLLILTKDLIRLKENKDINATAIVDLENRIQNYEILLDDKLNQFLNREQKDTKRISIQDISRPPIIYRILKHSYEINKREKKIEFIEKE